MLPTVLWVLVLGMWRGAAGSGSQLCCAGPSGLAVSAGVKNPASGQVTKVQLAGFSKDYPNELAAYDATLEIDLAHRRLV